MTITVSTGNFPDKEIDKWRSRMPKIHLDQPKLAGQKLP